MKKITTIITLIAIITLPLFASITPATFSVTTSVEYDMVIKILDEPVSSISALKGATSVEEFQVGGDQGLITTLYAVVGTNYGGSFDIKVTAPHMTHSVHSQSIISYTVDETSSGGSNPFTLASANPSSIARVFSEEFDIKVNSSEYENALAGSYSATMTFNVVTD
ncbi:MAG: hypothetical protein ACOX0W_04615 [Sphaerochaetaceae bacterium]